MLVRSFAVSLGVLFANACSTADAPNSTPPATETVATVQRSLAAPHAAAPPVAHLAAPAPAEVSAGTTPPTAASQPTPANPPSAGSAMVRLLGIPPAPLPTSQPSPASTSPHLFQIGATAFFLDHDELALTPDQRMKLAAIRDAAVLAYATAQRKIDQAEQDLWSLTSADRPFASAVEAKLAVIAHLSVQQRMSYIRAIGEAVAELPDAQRQLLAVGPAASAAPSSAPPMAMPSGAPPAAGPPAAVAAPGMSGGSGAGMGDM